MDRFDSVVVKVQDADRARSLEDIRRNRCQPVGGELKTSYISGILEVARCQSLKGGVSHFEIQQVRKSREELSHDHWDVPVCQLGSPDLQVGATVCVEPVDYESVVGTEGGNVGIKHQACVDIRISSIVEFAIQRPSVLAAS